MAPEGWAYVTLGELVTFSRGGTAFLKSEYSSTGVPVLAKGDVKPMGRMFHSGRYVPEDRARRQGYYFTTHDDLLVTTRDLTQAADFLGLVATVPTDASYLVNQGATVFRVDHRKILPEYLIYWCAGAEYRNFIKQRFVGSTQIHIRHRDLMDAPVLLPPLGDQQRIVDVLGALDRKIDLNRRTNKTLEELARSIFHSWFISFAPVAAKAQGALAYPGLSAEAFDLLPNQIERSQEATRPLGWDRVRLSDTIALIGGGTPSRKRPEYWDGSIPWFSVRDAPTESDVWTIETKESITDAGVANSSARVLRPGTTIISARGTVGRLAIAGVPMAINQSCYGVVGVEGIGDFYTYFSIQHAVTELQRRAHGSVFDTITRSTFESLVVVRPPALLLEEFERLVSPLLERVRANLVENLLLERTRDELLPALIRGDVKPSKLEAAGR